VEWSSNEVVIFGAGFGTDTIVNFAATGNGIDHLDFSAILGGAAGAVASSESTGTARTVSVTTETTANDTVDEIKALYNAIDATTSGAASKHLYVAAGTGVNVGKGKVYSVVDGAADNDVVVTLEGTVDLGSVALTGLTLTNFTAPSATAEGPANLAGTTQVAIASTTGLGGTNQDDVLNGAASTNVGGFIAFGNGGNDTITGSATVANTLWGDDGNDTITGGAVADTLLGNAGNDAISGGAGIDTIRGGTDVDTLTGGADADVFVFSAGDTGITLATADTIVDFATGADDISVSGAGATIADGTAQADFAAFLVAADAVLTAGAGNDDVYVAYNAAGTGNAWVVVDENDNGSVDANDTLIVLTGINLVTEIAVGDFV